MRLAASLLVVLAACSRGPSPQVATEAISARLHRDVAPTRFVGEINTTHVPWEVGKIEIRAIGDPVRIDFMHTTYIPVRARVHYRFEDGGIAGRFMRDAVREDDYQLSHTDAGWTADFWMWRKQPSYAAALGPESPPLENVLNP